MTPRSESGVDAKGSRAAAQCVESSCGERKERCGSSQTWALVQLCDHEQILPPTLGTSKVGAVSLRGTQTWELRSPCAMARLCSHTESSCSRGQREGLARHRPGRTRRVLLSRDEGGDPEGAHAPHFCTRMKHGTEDTEDGWEVRRGLDGWGEGAQTLGQAQHTAGTLDSQTFKSSCGFAPPSLFWFPKSY